MGDEAAWGLRARRAFDGARFRLLLSGTPFRSDNSAIPWVAYDEDGVSSADYVYGYPQALRDRVCRPITFLPYDGEMEWISDGRLRSGDFDIALSGAESARRLRTALTPEGEWMGHVLRDADARLSEVRAEGHPDAGGLVIASNQDHARAIAARLGSVAGQQPEHRDERRARRQQTDRRVRRLRPPLAGLGPDGLRGRRHPPPAGRRLRHRGPHRALLPPGRRPLHPHHPGRPAPADELPADARRLPPQGARPRDRGGAPPRPRPLADRRGGGRRGVRRDPDRGAGRGRRLRRR